jgi:hypothetical protein
MLSHGERPINDGDQFQQLLSMPEPNVLSTILVRQHPRSLPLVILVKTLERTDNKSDENIDDEDDYKLEMQKYR